MSPRDASPPSTGRAGEAHPLAVDAATASALRLWVILSRAQDAVAQHAMAHVAPHGLTIAEFGILEALYHLGPLLLSEVQKRLLVSSGGITFLVNRLQAKGLVERQSCPSDRRARYAALTPAGEALIARLFPEHAAVVTEAMQALTPAEQQTAADLLRRLGLAAASTPPAGRYHGTETG